MDVLVIDDRFEEKIGIFADTMTKAGLEYGIAGTLKTANEMFDSNSQDISTIILDLTFPKDDEDTVGILDRTESPNGIKFLERNGLQMKLKEISLILNSCWDDDERDRHFTRTNYYRESKDLIIEILSEKTPLSHLTETSMQQLIRALQEAKEKHETIVKAPKPTNDDAWKKDIRTKYLLHDGD